MRRRELLRPVLRMASPNKADKKDGSATESTEVAEETSNKSQTLRELNSSAACSTDSGAAQVISRQLD